MKVYKTLFLVLALALTSFLNPSHIEAMSNESENSYDFQVSGLVGLIPDISNISLKDFNLGSNTPVKSVEITIDSGDIEPDIFFRFNLNGNLEFFHEDWDGEYTNYYFSYDDTGKVKSVRTENFWDRDDTFSPVVNVLYTFDWVFGNLTGITEKVITVNGYDYGIPECHYNVDYDTKNAKIKKISCKEDSVYLDFTNGRKGITNSLVYPEYILDRFFSNKIRMKEINIEGWDDYLAVPSKKIPLTIFRLEIDPYEEDDSYNQFKMKLWDSSLSYYTTYNPVESPRFYDDSKGNWTECVWKVKGYIDVTGEYNSPEIRVKRKITYYDTPAQSQSSTPKQSTSVQSTHQTPFQINRPNKKL